MKLLDQKTAIVTGGSRGIGKSIVLKFAEHGANVVFTYISSSEKAEEVVKLCEKYDVNVTALQSDASNYLSTQKLIDSVLMKHGSIDILVNNAGVTKDNLLLRMTESDFDSVMNINMKSVFNMTKSVQKSMLKAKSGSLSVSVNL